jgi:hypothetical protein
MLNVRKLLARRVTITHKHSCLLVRIAPRNDRIGNIYPCLLMTVAFILYCSVFVKPFLRGPWRENISYLSLFLGLGGVAYCAVMLALFWASFGREEIEVANGVMRWTCKALWWVRKIEIPASEISGLKAITPWYGNNHVEIVVTDGRRGKIGDRLLHDETVQLSQALRDAIGTQRRAQPPA